MEFQIGDRIIAAPQRVFWGGVRSGDTGTVKDIRSEIIGVLWDRKIPGGHNCDLPGLHSNQCTWVHFQSIQLLQEDDALTLDFVPHVEDII